MKTGRRREWISLYMVDSNIISITQIIKKMIYSTLIEIIIPYMYDKCVIFCNNCLKSSADFMSLLLSSVINLQSLLCGESLAKTSVINPVS